MNTLLVSIFGLFALANHPSASISAEEQVTQCVKQFVKGADQQNQGKIAAVLHDHFRVMLNPGDGDIQSISKDQYLSLIEENKIGGKPRAVSIEQVDVYGSKTANVKAQIKSEKMTFYSYYSLMKAEEEWRIVQDLVYVTPN